MSNRRTFIKLISTLAVMPLILPTLSASAKRKPRILLRSSWQTVNIGDIGHTFGIIALIRKYIPKAEVILWPVNINGGVESLLQKSFPGLRIVKGRFEDADSIAELERTFHECDVFVHSSGPYVVRTADFERWQKLTGKPFGMYGISLETADDRLKNLLNEASFIFLRDTISLQFTRSLALKCPMVAFAPDATFAITLQNKRKAENYLQSVGLEKKGFICAIPRLRYTPYFQLNGTAPTAEEKRRYEISMKFKEADAEKLRAVISRWVNETGLKVLLCPEMTYQVALSKEVLLDPLPENVKKNVVWRDSYWHPDEAGSIYANAISLVSYEMHSPIIAFHQGVPSVHLKQPTDTTKGQMWSDIGLGEWLFEIDTTSANQIGDAVMKIYREPAFAQAKMKAAAKFLKEKQQVSMSAVARLL